MEIQRTEKEKFDAYEKVRKRGVYNMILNATGAMNAAGLNIEEYFSVVENYDSLKEKYKETNLDFEYVGEIIDNYGYISPHSLHSLKINSDRGFYE